MRAAATLLLALALAGCGADEGAALQKREQEKAAELAKLQGWDRAFRPDAALAAANQFGLKALGYSPSTNGYRMFGGPTMIASNGPKVGSQVSFEATGAKQDLIDSIRFELAFQDGAADARKRFADLVRDFLFQSKIDAKPLHEALAKGSAGDGTLAGTRYTIAKKPADATGIHRMTVTFHRTGASAPANS